MVLMDLVENASVGKVDALRLFPTAGNFTYRKQFNGFVPGGIAREDGRVFWTVKMLRRQFLPGVAVKIFQVSP